MMSVSARLTDQSASPARNPAEPVARGQQAARPGQHREPAMPLGHQRPGQGLGTGRVLGQDRVDAEQVLPDARGPAARADERGDLCSQLGDGDGVGRPAADDDHRAGPLRPHQRHVLPLAALARRAGQADQELARMGDLDQAGRDRGEVRVGDVVHDHADHVALAGRDGAGLQVRGVAELGGGLVDPVGELAADPPRPVAQHPGGRGQRYAGPVGDVLQGGHVLSSDGS